MSKNVDMNRNTEAEWAADMFLPMALRLMPLHKSNVVVRRRAAEEPNTGLRLRSAEAHPGRRSAIFGMCQGTRTLRMYIRTASGWDTRTAEVMRDSILRVPLSTAGSP